MYGKISSGGDKMNLEELYTMNPWWYDRSNIEEDRNLRFFPQKR